MCKYVVALLVACAGGDPSTSSGSTVVDPFPFGHRTWDYISTDVTLSYKLIGEAVAPAAAQQGLDAYAISYVKECVRADPDCVPGESLRRLDWSSTVGEGVFVHGYTVGAGAAIPLDPPLQVTLDGMQPGDLVETVTAGATWTSTMVSIGSCPIAMNAAWDDCGLFDVRVDAGDGYPIAGRWWAQAVNGVAAMEIATEAGQWQLSDLTCDRDCDGIWIW